MEHDPIESEQKKRLEDLIREDGTECWDWERVSLFYIVAGSEKLYRKRYYLYDFKERCIRTCIKESGEDFSSSEWALIKLGFNLYNGYREENMTPIDLFWNLDDQNKRTAYNAIGFRFNI